MNGCDNLAPEFSEEAIGHNALAAGFQGQRQWTDFYPNGDFAEAMLNTSFDWNGAREPYILATENDVLNGLGMLFMKLLTGRALMFVHTGARRQLRKLQDMTLRVLPKKLADSFI